MLRYSAVRGSGDGRGVYPLVHASLWSPPASAGARPLSRAPQGASLKPKRYSDRKELVRAVREHCQAWLEENTGHPWPPEDYPSSADRENMEIEREAAKIFERLRKALLDALDFSSRTPPRSGHAAAFEVRDLSAGVSRRRLEEGRVPSPLSDRTVFLLDWDHDRWLGRAPTNRELALLSLFFGNFPTVDVNKKRPTENEIIALETNAIRAERVRAKRKRE